MRAAGSGFRPAARKHRISGGRPGRGHGDRDRHGARAHRVACPATGRRGQLTGLRERHGERGCRNGRPNVAGRVTDHERAAAQQRAASGGARVHLADHGEAVAVTHGRLPGATDPDAEIHVPPADTHAHVAAHVNRHADRARHAAAELHGHLSTAGRAIMSFRYLV